MQNLNVVLEIQMRVFINQGCTISVAQYTNKSDHLHTN